MPQEIPRDQTVQSWNSRQPVTTQSTDKTDFDALDDNDWMYVRNVATFLEISRHQARRLMKKGAIISEKPAGAMRAFTSELSPEFAVAEHTLEEVKKFIPELAKDLDEDEHVLHSTLALLPLTVYPKAFYEGKRTEAERRIAHRDPDDVDVLALALKLNCPVWSNDADFSECKIEWYTTARLLKVMGF